MIPFYFYISTEAQIPNTSISIKCTFLTFITTSLSCPNSSQVTNIFPFSSSLHCCLFQISLPPRLILLGSQINSYPEKCFLQVKIHVQYAFPCALKQELLKAWGVAGKGWKSGERWEGGSGCWWESWWGSQSCSWDLQEQQQCTTAKSAPVIQLTK